MGSPRFNYIITIHNKEELIEQVLMAILLCCRDNSYVYPVLDGCNDRTEEIVDSIIEKYSNLPITKVITPDVHEILSINAGLKAADQTGEAYNIILQDDVILADFRLEERIERLYEWGGSELGFISLRLGANFAEDAVHSSEINPFKDYLENAYGHGLPEAELLLPGYFSYRTVAVKSPVCLPSKLIQSIGLLDERLAPYMCDDIEYALRSSKAGFRNGVFGVRYYSDIKWGTTRTKPDDRMLTIHHRNMDLIREWHGATIEQICQHPQNTHVVAIPGLVSEASDQMALAAWEQNRQNFTAFSKIRGWRTFHRIKSAVKQSLRK
jgi:glycosyltransferase involved in cell wall biosynthesis